MALWDFNQGEIYSCALENLEGVKPVRGSYEFVTFFVIPS